MAKVDEEIGANVRRLREQAGWTQAQLAERLSASGLDVFHPQTITKIEKGDRALKYSEATTLARVLEVSLDDLAAPPPDSEVNIAVTMAVRATARALARVCDAVSDHREAQYKLFMALEEDGVAPARRKFGQESLESLTLGAGILAAFGGPARLGPEDRQIMFGPVADELLGEDHGHGSAAQAAMTGASDG